MNTVEYVCVFFFYGSIKEEGGGGGKVTYFPFFFSFFLQLFLLLPRRPTPTARPVGPAVPPPQYTMTSSSCLKVASVVVVVSIGWLVHGLFHWLTCGFLV